MYSNVQNPLEIVKQTIQRGALSFDVPETLSFSKYFPDGENNWVGWVHFWLISNRTN